MQNSNGGGVNNKVSALATLLNKLDLTTLLAVLVMGGGNLFVTGHDGRLTRDEADRVIRQINALHSELSEWSARQKVALERLDKIQKTQEQILALPR